MVQLPLMDPSSGTSRVIEVIVHLFNELGICEFVEIEIIIAHVRGS